MTNKKDINKMPYNLDNQLQTKLGLEGKDVENFMSRLGRLSDEEIASELNVSLQDARQMRQEYERGSTAGLFVVD